MKTQPRDQLFSSVKWEENLFFTTCYSGETLETNTKENQIILESYENQNFVETTESIIPWVSSFPRGTVYSNQPNKHALSVRYALVIAKGPKLLEAEE